ncbi:MAG: 5-methyltetrahydrofolate--homocysteine methyltransferase [Oscillospiraceae bacterium]|nr:5-methyltetrahydrofolate--homocysteine methyltransferase [Oscillospiraceae bacterium]
MKPSDLNRAEILSYLRTPELDAELDGKLTVCIEELCRAAVPRTVWRLLPVQHSPEGVRLGGLLLGGKDIALHLEGCRQAVLFAATLSSPVDALIRRAEVSDMTKAVMLDAVAGAAIESVCSQLELFLHRELGAKYYTERFSAGYGDFPLSQQADLIALLDASRKIGLTVTQHQTLVPMKSVTAVFGLSDRPVNDARRYCCGKSCTECPNRDGCLFAGAKAAEKERIQ